MTSTAFEINQQIENRVDQESPKPEFFEIFLSHYNQEELKDLWSLIQDSDFGQHIFLRGLFHEYGVFPLSKADKATAYEAYQRGAEKRDSYCNLRLHFVFKKDFQEFNIEKDRFKEMLHLIKAAAFFDEKDNRINRKFLDPVMHLAVHLDNEDPDLIKCVELLEKYKESSEENKVLGDFLHYWCCVRFSLSDQTKEECLDNLAKIAEQKDPEACYFLGEAYRYGEEFRQDLDISKKYLETAKENGCAKAIESLGYLYQLNKQPEASIQNYKEGAEIGSYTSLKILGEYQIVGKYTPQDFEKGLKNIYYAYLQCDFWALLTMYEIYKYFELKEKKNSSIQARMFHLAKTLFDIKGKIGKIAHIRLAYSVYSECFEKGYGTAKDLNKARSILMESLEKIEMEKLKTFIYHRLAIIAERKGDYDEANRFYDSCIRACLKMVEGHNIIKNQAYYYLLGKLLYIGRGTIKNIEKAIEYLQEGAKMENFFYFGAIYSKKCQNLLKKIAIDGNLMKIKFIKQQQQETSIISKKVKSTQIYGLKDVKLDLYVQTVGPVKIFYGRLKDQPVKFAEYFYASKNNYIEALNNVITLINIKDPYLEEVIGVAVDPRVSEVIAIYKPLDRKFFTLEEIYEMEKNYDNKVSSRPDIKSTLAKSQETEECVTTERSHSRYSLNQKLDICSKISKAMQHLHSEKIVHGNLTPKSVYMTLDGEVKVTAFGYENPRLFDSNGPWIRDADDDTVRYLAPESLQKIKRSDLRSDIWSLGCIIYMIFYERHPFGDLKSEEITQIYKKKVQPDFKYQDENVPKTIQDLLKQCINPNPSHRCNIFHITDTFITVLKSSK